jgi:hypothetical protein
MINALKGKYGILLDPQTVTNGATATANLDCRGADFATIAIQYQSEANTNLEGPTVSLLECDTTVASSFATFDANFEIAATAEDITNDRLRLYHVDTRARKRYLRLSITPGTTDTNDKITMAALSVLHRLGEAPASTTDMVMTTNDVAVVG